MHRWRRFDLSGIQGATEQKTAQTIEIRLRYLCLSLKEL